MAIGIKVKKAPKGYYVGASKFFGAPTVPLSWEGDFYEDEIFLCQINLADLAHLDAENRLPHKGYLYFFLLTSGGYYDLRADVRYSEEEPQLAINEFNEQVEEYKRFNQAYLMEFYKVDDNEDCTRLFGKPSDWNYAKEAPKMLMQFDPLDSEMGFLDFLDGFMYFFFSKDESDFNKVFLHVEFS